MNDSLGRTYLESAIKRLLTYKDLGDKTFAQLSDADFHFQPNAVSNSLAVIVQHLGGNMLSRWTGFLAEDGEKPWRDRDGEFEDRALSKAGILDIWEKGWSCMLDSLRSLQPDDLLKTVSIRGESLSAVDAINRQLAHIPHHVGQIIYLGKIIRGQEWKNLSIPKGKSKDFNSQMTSLNKG
jgi:hypothetical protein